MSFFKAYFGDDTAREIESLYPVLRPKFKNDYFTLEGKRFNYEDVSKFVIIRDGDKVSYKPYIFATKDEGEVIQGASLLSVAIMELVSMGYNSIEKVFGYFEHYVLGMNIATDIEVVNDVSSKLSCKSLETSDELGIYLAYSLRTGFQEFGFSKVKYYSSLLFAINSIDPKTFTIILFDIFKYACTLLPAFLLDRKKVSNIMYSKGMVKGGTMNDWNKGVLNLKAYSYTDPSSKSNTITNGRGASIGFFSLLLCSLYDNFAVNRNSKNVISLSFNEYIKNSQKLIEHSLGSDITGFYLKGKRKSLDSKCIKLGDCVTDFIVFKGDSKVDLKGASIVREVFEEEFLFRKAYGVHFNEPVSVYNFNRDISMHYFSPKSFIIAYSLLLSTSIDYDELSFLRKKVLDQNISHRNEVKNLQSEISNLRYKVQDSSSVQSEIDSLRSQITELKFQLESKQSTINSLNERNNELKEAIMGYYSDDDVFEDDCTLDESLTLEDKIKFINDYKILIIGGRTGIINDLQDLGLNNIYHVGTERDLNSTGTSVDFLLLNTRFCSHKLVNCVRERYKNQLDSLFYFNGVNKVNLINACYNFIYTYLS